MYLGRRRQNRKQLRPLSAIATMLAVASTASAATLQGDCDDNGNVAIFELQRCVNAYLNPALLAPCPPCDQNGDADVDIAEIQGAANCFKDASASGCVMITPPATAVSSGTPTPPDTATPLTTDTPTAAAANTPQATATPQEPTAMPTEGLSVCGNGDVESGESCDDGNTEDGCVATGCDSCPFDCIIESCTPDGTSTVVDVNFMSPVNLTSITISLDYPDGSVQIPGAQTAASVGARITNRLPGLATFIDFDYLLRGVVSSGAFPRTRIFTATFDNCVGAPPVTAEDFVCAVQEAVDTGFANVSGVTCSVSFP